jgi:hypothetical protein
MKAAIEEFQGLALRTIVRVVCAYERLYLRSDEAANRGVASSSEDSRLSDRFTVEANGHILFHCALRVPRAAQ